MKRSPRDMALILLLIAVAFTGIHALSKRIMAAQSVGETDPFTLIPAPPQAVLCLHQPQTLELMLPTLPNVERLLRAYLPENPLCQPERIGVWLPFTLIYYPEGELWMAQLTPQEARQLWKRLDACHAFAAEEQTELTIPVRYYPERGRRFLGCYYQQGIFVASYQRQLVRKSIEQLLRRRTADPMAQQLQARKSPSAPLQLLLPSERLFPADRLRETATPWLSLPFFFNEGHLCCFQEWPLPTSIPDSLLTTHWLEPLRDSLSLRLQPLLPGVQIELEATREEKSAYFAFRTH